MKIQITNYGVQCMIDTGKPIEIVRCVLGSSYGYVPSLDQESIVGDSLFTTSVVGPSILTANVYKFSAFLDYLIGDFSFGEIAYFDKNGKCVAVAVSDELIEKKRSSNEGFGNSIRIDAFLSMIGSNFYMWTDSVGSDIGYHTPVLDSVDVLPLVHESDPNMYIIKGPSEKCSSVLAFGSTDGLWNFDGYQYNNVRRYTIIEAGETTVTISTEGLDNSARSQLLPQFYGDKIIEFSSGELYSICRTVYHVTLTANTAVITYSAPTAIVPKVGDSILYFSRSQITVSDLVLPIASETNLGAIIVGDGLSVTSEGVLSSDVMSVNGQIGEVNVTANDISGLSTVAKTGNYGDLIGAPSAYVLPVASSVRLGGVMPNNNEFTVLENGALQLANRYIKTVNGNEPDENGNIVIDESGSSITGLVNPLRIPSTSSLDTYKTVGLFYSDPNSTQANNPFPGVMYTLEVLPMNDGQIIQRAYCVNGIKFRNFNGQSFSEWTSVNVGTSSLPIASGNRLGTIMVGNGLSITDRGVLSAQVESFNSRTGAIELQSDDVMTALESGDRFNTPDGIPRLSPTSLDMSDQEIAEAARISYRNLSFGALYYYAWLNAELNRLDEEEGAYIVEGGQIVGPLGDDDTEYTQWQCDGYLLYVNVAGNIDVDGLGYLNVGDIIISINQKWQVLSRAPGFYIKSAGARGLIAGYESIEQESGGTTVTDSSPDSIYVSSGSISVRDGLSNVAWTKKVCIQTASSVTLGSKWRWEGGEAAELTDYCVLVLSWNGTWGYASLCKTSK